MPGRTWILTLFLLFCLAGSAICQEDRETDIVVDSDTWSTAVFDFETLGRAKELEEDIGKMARTWLRERLQQAGRFELVDLEEAAEIIGNEVSMRDLIDSRRTTEIGKLLGWQIAIRGKIMGYGDSVDIYASLQVIQTGKIIHIVKVTGKGQREETIKELVEQLALNIGSVFPPKGEVVAIQKDVPEKEVVLNKGNIHGLRPGMRFDIYKTKEIAENIFEEIKLAIVEATEVTATNCFARISEIGDTPIEKGHQFRAISLLGRLKITTEPPGASISFSGNPLTGFSTPATIHVQPGIHSLSLSKPGFVTWSDPVTIEPYETTPLNVTLEKLEFSIELPPGEVQARKSYPLIVRDYRGRNVSVDGFHWEMPLGLAMKMERGEAKIEVADVERRSMVMLEGIWKQDRMAKASKEITILPRSGIWDMIWRHKYKSAGVLVSMAYVIYRLIPDEDGKEDDNKGEIEITFTF